MNFFSYVLHCYSENYSWALKASFLNNSNLLRIRIFNDLHSCQLSEREIIQVQATIAFVCGIISPKLIIRKRNHIPGDIIEEMKALYDFDINYMKA